MTLAWRRRLAALCCAAAVVAAGYAVRLPYFVVVPGVTRAAGRLVRVEGLQPPGEGRLLLVTVGMQPVNVWLYMYGLLNPLAELRTREQVLGPEGTYEQYNRENEQLMVASQETARLAALYFTGQDGAWAAGQPEMATAAISGPSAGLVFTLELVRQLLGEDLAAGKVVAATGTVTATGDVGVIGGVRQKVAAAERAGAEVFLVPTANAAVAAAAARHIQIIAVDSVAEAVAALRSLAAPAR